MIRDAAMLEALLDGIRRFVREVLVPAEREVDETDEIPSHIVQGMKDLGLCGITIPEACGGLGQATQEEVLAAIEVCQTSSAFRSLIGTTVGIGSQGILLDATRHPRRPAWLLRSRPDSGKGWCPARGIAEGVRELEQRTGLDMSDEAQRFETRDAIAELVEPWFATRTREQAERELMCTRPPGVAMAPWVNCWPATPV
ncbi:acyl-CoA dehydrogenase family protein [Bradyrhizobium sp. USDA 4504]